MPKKKLQDLQDLLPDRRALLTDRRVATIKKDIIDGKMTQAEIAKKRKVSRSTISDIDSERSWSEVPWPGDHVPKTQGPQRKRVPKHDPTDQRILVLEAEVED